MRLKDWSVARKIWFLLFMVVGAIMVAGMSMTLYMSAVERDLRQAMQAQEERIRLGALWHEATERALNSVVAAAMTQEQELRTHLDQITKEGIGEASRLQNLLQEQVTSEAGKTQLAKVVQVRARVLEINDQATRLRNQGGDAAAFVRSQLIPVVQQYFAEQHALVQQFEQQRDAMIQDGERQRDRAFLTGNIALGAVVLLGLWGSVVMVRQLTQPLAQAVQLADTIASGDLTREIDDDRRDELGQLLRSLNQMTRQLRSLVGDVRQGVESVSSAADQIATGNQDLSARTEQTASYLQETAASMEELTATVTHSNDHAQQAHLLAAEAAQAAERGGSVVRQVVGSMEQIHASSRKIEDIIGVIDTIAFQTNILALNAAVEAARAGEQGRGFAVVASEVRSLAQRSAQAAKEIKQLITDSVSSVDAGSVQVRQAGERMDDIMSSVQRVSALISDISTSAREQRDGITQVNQAVSHLDEMTQQNAALVEESSAAAASMSEQARRLAQVVARFQIGQGGAALSAARRPAPAAVAPRPSGRRPSVPAVRSSSAPTALPSARADGDA